MSNDESPSIANSPPSSHAAHESAWREGACAVGGASSAASSSVAISAARGRRAAS